MLKSQGVVGGVFVARAMTDEEKREYDRLTANMEQMRLRLDELTAGPAVYGYARVSTRTQNLDRQVDNIKKENPQAIIFQE